MVEYRILPRSQGVVQVFDIRPLCADQFALGFGVTSVVIADSQWFFVE